MVKTAAPQLVWRPSSAVLLSSASLKYSNTLVNKNSSDFPSVLSLRISSFCSAESKHFYFKTDGKILHLKHTSQPTPLASKLGFQIVMSNIATFFGRLQVVDFFAYIFVFNCLSFLLLVCNSGQQFSDFL